MAKGIGSDRGVAGVVGARRGGTRALAALVLAALALGACEEAGPVVPARTAVPAPSTPPTPIASVSTEPVAPRDPEGVPDFGPSTACPAVTGDARAMRTRLRALERGRELVPPDTASLLEGCGALPADIARSLEKAGRAIARARSHDYAAAAAYYRRAIEIDPSYVSARLALAGARSKVGDVDGAMYQLDQIRDSGATNRRYAARVYTEGTLASLRLTPRFWAWAGNPVPEMVATLPAATAVSLDSLGSALSFAPSPEIESGVIFARFPIAGSNYSTLRTAVSSATGMRMTRTTSIARDKMTSPWLEHLDTIGATLLTRPAAFRFGEGEVVLAIPFMYGDVDMEQFAVVIAKGPESGPFDLVRVITAGAECGTPAAFTSRDRRVLGFFTSCDEGDDPTRFGRCILFEENGTVASRCGNGGSISAVVGAGYGSGDADEDYGDEYLEEEESYEDYGD